MKQLVIFLSILLFSIGCASGPEVKTISLAELAQKNQLNINKLSIGITKTDLVSLLGDNVAKTHDGLVSYPFHTEAFIGEQGIQYDVLYYVTAKNQTFKRLTLKETTPLIFKNGTLIGWGLESLNRVSAAKEIK